MAATAYIASTADTTITGIANTGITGDVCHCFTNIGLCCPSEALVEVVAVVAVIGVIAEHVSRIINQLLYSNFIDWVYSETNVCVEKQRERQ